MSHTCLLLQPPEPDHYPQEIPVRLEVELLHRWGDVTMIIICIMYSNVLVLLNDSM